VPILQLVNTNQKTIDFSSNLVRKMELFSKNQKLSLDRKNYKNSSMSRSVFRFTTSAQNLQEQTAFVMFSIIQFYDIAACV
jgi:hypothetical protein